MESGTKWDSPCELVGGFPWPRSLPAGRAFTKHHCTVQLWGHGKQRTAVADLTGQRSGIMSLPVRGQEGRAPNVSQLVMQSRSRSQNEPAHAEPQRQAQALHSPSAQQPHCILRDPSTLASRLYPDLYRRLQAHTRIIPQSQSRLGGMFPRRQILSDLGAQTPLTGAPRRLRCF